MSYKLNTNPKELVIPLYTKRVDESLTIYRTVFDVKRIVISMVAIFSLGLVVFLADQENESVVSLSIFACILFLLFSFLLSMILIKRPKTICQIKKGMGKTGECIFGPKSFTITYRGEDPIILSYNDICGQYWNDDIFCLYVDSKNYSSVLSFLINKDTFDLIYMLADALSKRKIKLIQIKSKKMKIGKKREMAI